MEPVESSDSGIKVEKEETSGDADTSKTLVESSGGYHLTTTAAAIKTTASIYVLEKTLYNFAEGLQNFLTQDCQITACECWQKHIGNTIAETCANFGECRRSKISYAYEVEKTVVSIHDYEYLERLMTEAKGSGDEILGLQHNVVIILGHNSVLLAEDKKFIETVGKINPTVIAFIGCSGGNARYGPIRTMSYLLPAHCKPVMAFYQRRVYKTEVKDTSLMIGLQYYLHIKNSNSRSTSQNCMHAFGLAMIKSQSFMCTDPTVFIDGEDFVHEICDKKVKVVPLPCIQLAMYTPMIITNSEEFLSKFKQEMDNKLAEKAARKPLSNHEVGMDDNATQRTYQERLDLGTDNDKKPVSVEEVSLSSETSSGVGSTECSKVRSIWNLSSDDQLTKRPASFEITLGVQQMDTETDSDARSIVSSEVSTEGNHLDCSGTSGVDSMASSKVSIDELSIDNPEEEKLEITGVLHSETSIDELSSDNQLTAEEEKILITDLLYHKCREKIEDLELHKIIPLICEIRFITLLEDTKTYMRKGKKSLWKDIDPLQFLVAVLHGHWGMNSAIVIKEWATYHLVQAMKNIKDTELLHQYKLCCMCFVLIWEDSFVRFVKLTEEDKYPLDIIAYTTKDNELIDITCDDTKLVSEPADPGGLFPPDTDLLGWEHLFNHCIPLPDCVNLFNSNANRSRQETWNIRNYFEFPLQQQTGQYRYSYEELLFSLGALSDGAQYFTDDNFEVKTLRQACYHVSPFYNEDNENKGCVKIFPFQPGVVFIETRLLLNTFKFNGNDWKYFLNKAYERDTATQGIVDRINYAHRGWTKTSSCRFVFARTSVTPRIGDIYTIEGILFYTDTHYGHNLIDLTQLHQIRNYNRCRNVPTCFDNLSRRFGHLQLNTVQAFIGTIYGLCPSCRYKMLHITITDISLNLRPRHLKFPFYKVGNLMLIYNEEQLHEIRLADSPEAISRRHMDRNRRSN